MHKFNKNHQEFSESICQWYRQNKRDLPFRKTQDPYLIYISEIMLQQTQIKTVLPYYQRFITRFPNIEALAMASYDEVHKLWEGLGYYSRAANLHQTAKHITQYYEGKFPQTLSELRDLKGIGRYTAAAIHSIAFNQPSIAIDGNVKRVVSRYMGYKEDLNKAKNVLSLETWLLEAIQYDIPRDFTQALMEMGALVCLKKPLCHLCPLRDGCYAYVNNKIDSFPFKTKTIVKKEETYFVFAILNHKNEAILRQRPSKGLLALMLEFPQYQTTTLEIGLSKFAKEFSVSILDTVYIDTIKHVFTHKIWIMHIHKVRIDTIENITRYMNLNHLPKAMSKAHLKIIDLLKK